MIKAQDFAPLITALESIQISGSKDIGTMNNIFNYVMKLAQEVRDEEEKYTAESVESEA